jgi:iron complex transport system substrate-binding protein
MASARTAALLIVIALGAGCGRPRPTGPSLVDEVGHACRPRALPARRVVSLAANVTEILFAIGAGERVVGVDRYSDFPKEVDKIPRVGSEFEPSLEKLVGLAPDVVVTAYTANRRETVESLERLGIPVYVTRTEGLEALPRTIEDLGQLVGKQREASQVSARTSAAIAATRAHAAAAGASVPTLIVVWSDPLFVVGNGSYTGDVLAAAGGRNVADDARAGFPKYSLERVLRRAPEVIIVGTHKDDAPGTDPLGYWRRWTSLPAVRTGRLHSVDGDLLFRPGPRLADGARVLSELLHP